MSVRAPVAEQGALVDESVAGLPATELRPYVARYNGYRQAGVAPAKHAGLPSPYLTLIVTLDEPVTILEHPDPRQAAGEYRTLAGGLHSTPALVTHDGRQSGVQIALSPLGSLAILGVPAGELARIDVEAADLVGPLAAELQERVRGAADWPARFGVVDEVLSRRLRAYRETGKPDVSDEVGFAWRRLLATGGLIGIRELATQTGWSDRHLRARFAAEIGLTPKTAARIVRFDRARHDLARRATANRVAQQLDLAELAARYGYYDQAHLDAEFRVIAGSSPTGWLAREFQILQATAAAGEPGRPAALRG